jgi:hypothetical protein
MNSSRRASFWTEETKDSQTTIQLLLETWSQAANNLDPPVISESPRGKFGQHNQYLL